MTSSFSPVLRPIITFTAAVITYHDLIIKTSLKADHHFYCSCYHLPWPHHSAQHQGLSSLLLLLLLPAMTSLFRPVLLPIIIFTAAVIICHDLIIQPSLKANHRTITTFTAAVIIYHDLIIQPNLKAYHHFYCCCYHLPWPHHSAQLKANHHFYCCCYHLSWPYHSAQSQGQSSLLLLLLSSTMTSSFSPVSRPIITFTAAVITYHDLIIPPSIKANHHTILHITQHFYCCCYHHHYLISPPRTIWFNDFCSCVMLFLMPFS